MEGISNNVHRTNANSTTGGSKVAGYEASKVQNISQMLQKVDVSQYDISTFTAVSTDYYGMKLHSDPARMAMWTETDSGKASAQLIADVRSSVNNYFDGKISLEGLQSEYKTLVQRHVDTVTENSILPSKQLTQCAAEAVHDLFRQTVLDAAVSRNNAEGRQYVSDSFNSKDRAYKYYNADYYYQSEEVLSALTESAKLYGIEHDFEFGSLDTSPKLTVVGDDRYKNFNTAWNTDISGIRSNNIIDTEQAPPENFKWFYEGPNLAGENGEGKITLISVTSELPNGKTITEYFHNAYTWSSWSEDAENYNQYYRISAEVHYGWNQEELDSVAALIGFSTGNPEVDVILNSFLENLQLYHQTSFGGISVQA